MSPIGSSPTIRSFLRSTAILFAIVFAVAIAPRAALVFQSLIPSRLTNALFLWPQYVFFYPHFFAVGNGDSAGAKTLGGNNSYILSLIQWLLLMAVLGWFTKRLRPWTVLALGVSVVIVVSLALHVLLEALGYRFELQGF